MKNKKRNRLSAELLSDQLAEERGAGPGAHSVRLPQRHRLLADAQPALDHQKIRPVAKSGRRQKGEKKTNKNRTIFFKMKNHQLIECPVSSSHRIPTGNPERPVNAISIECIIQ